MQLKSLCVLLPNHHQQALFTRRNNGDAELISAAAKGAVLALGAERAMQTGSCIACLPIPDYGAKQPCCPVQLMVRVIVQEPNLIIHAVDEALQQGLLPLVAGSLQAQSTSHATGSRACFSEAYLYSRSPKEWYKSLPAVAAVAAA